MRYIFISFFLTLLLSGCEYLPAYQAPVQQGNIIQANLVQQLQLGMSQQDAMNLLGTPVLENTFADNRFNYVYTYKSMKQPYSLQRLVLIFSNNRLVKITNLPVGDTQHLISAPSVHP